MFDGIRSFIGKAIMPRAQASGEAMNGGRSTRHREDKAYKRRYNLDEERSVGPWNRAKTLLECRDLLTNSPLAIAISGTLERNVVGMSGLTPEAKTGDKVWDDAAEEHFREWCKIADYRGRTNFAGLQRLCIPTRLSDGIVAFVMTDTGQLQGIEAERIATPSDKARDGSIINGCKLDPTGRVAGWYVHARNQHGGVSADYEFVDAVDMIFLSAPFRFDQIFGHPDLAAAINPLKDLDDFKLSTLLTARLQSRQAVAIKTEQGAGRSAMMSAKDATEDTAQKRVKEEFDGYTAKHYLETGEAIENIANPTPGPQFVGYTEQQGQDITALFGLPWDFVTMNFHKGSFAQSKAALSLAYKTIQAWQIWLRDGLCQRVWNWVIARAIKFGDLPPAPVDSRGFSTWYKVDWTFPDREWIDPKDAIDAEMAEFRMGKTTLSRITGKTGAAWEDTLRQKAKELQVAKQIETEFGLQPGDLVNAYTNAQAPIQPGAANVA